MPSFQYVGTDAQQVELGSIHEFDADPHDSRWAAVDAKKPEKADGKEKPA